MNDKKKEIKYRIAIQQHDGFEFSRFANIMIDSEDDIDIIKQRIEKTFEQELR